MRIDADFVALPERDRQTILDVHRYGMTTLECFRKMRCPDLSPDASRKFFSRSVEQGWLARHELNDQEVYFVLGRRALAALGVRRSTKPLGPQAQLEHYAVLLACVSRGCDVFSEDEFKKAFPDLSQPGFSAKNFFLDESAGTPRLGLFVVDHDKQTPRLVGKVRRRVGTLLAIDRPEMRQQILDGQLAIYVLTATEGKRANLESAFARKERPLSVPVVIEAHPQLESLFLVKRR